MELDRREFILNNTSNLQDRSSSACASSLHEDDGENALQESFLKEASNSPGELVEEVIFQSPEENVTVSNAMDGDRDANETPSVAPTPHCSSHSNDRLPQLQNVDQPSKASKNNSSHDSTPSEENVSVPSHLLPRLSANSVPNPSSSCTNSNSPQACFPGNNVSVPDSGQGLNVPNLTGYRQPPTLQDTIFKKLLYNLSNAVWRWRQDDNYHVWRFITDFRKVVPAHIRKQLYVSFNLHLPYNKSNSHSFLF